MNLTLLLNTSAYLSGTLAPLASAPGNGTNGSLEMERDLAWQRAFQHAQEADFTNWFEPSAQKSGTAGAPRAALGKVIPHQSAVPASPGLGASTTSAQAHGVESGEPGAQGETPSARTLPAGGAGSGAADAPDGRPSAHASPDLSSPPVAPSGVAMSQAASAPETPEAQVDGRSGLKPATPGPSAETGSLSAASEATIPARTVATSGVGAASVPNESADNTGPLGRSSPADTLEKNGALAVSGFVQSSNNPVAGSALAGALASALEAALPVAVTAMTSADAVASIHASAGLQPGAALAGGVDSRRVDADIVLAEAAPKDDTAESTSTTPGPFRTGPLGTSPNVDAREPIRLHAEWSDQGVSVWLGSDANQTLPLVSLMGHVQQWLTVHGERLRALVWNGRAVPLGSLNNETFRSFEGADGAPGAPSAHSSDLPNRD